MFDQRTFIYFKFLSTFKVQTTFLFATVNKNTCNSDHNFLLLWSLLTWQLSYLFRTVSDH